MVLWCVIGLDCRAGEGADVIHLGGGHLVFVVCGSGKILAAGGGLDGGEGSGGLGGSAWAAGVCFGGRGGGPEGPGSRGGRETGAEGEGPSSRCVLVFQGALPALPAPPHIPWGTASLECVLHYHYHTPPPLLLPPPSPHPPPPGANVVLTTRVTSLHCSHPHTPTKTLPESLLPLCFSRPLLLPPPPPHRAPHPPTPLQAPTWCSPPRASTTCASNTLWRRACWRCAACPRTTSSEYHW